MKAGKIKEDIKFLEKEMKLHPNEEMLLRCLGYAYLFDQQIDMGEKLYQKAIVINPNCGNCYNNLGRIYLTKNDSKKALEYTDQAIKINPNEANYYSVRSDCYSSSGNFYMALFDLKKAIELAPKEASLYLQRGKLNAYQKKYSSAIDDFNKSITLDSTLIDAYLCRAESYQAEAQFELALKDLNLLLKKDSSSADFYNARAVVYDGMKEYQKSINDYTKAIHLNPNYIDAYYNRCSLWYTMENMDNFCIDLIKTDELLRKKDPESSMLEAIKIRKKGVCDSSLASYYYQRGIASYNIGNYENAVAWYDRGLKKFPTNSYCISFKGNAHLRLGQNESAIKEYEKMLDPELVMDDLKFNANTMYLSTDSMKIYAAQFISTNYSSIAEAKIHLKDYEGALIAIEKAIALLPKNGIEGFSLLQSASSDYNIRGDIYLAQEKYDLAILDFNYAIRLDANFPLPYVNRALAKINQIEKIKMATVSVQYNNNIQPISSGWTFPINNSSVNANNALLSSALSDCNTALAIEKQFAYAYYIRGHLKKMMTMGDYCSDFLKAGELLFPVEYEIIKMCNR